MDEAFFEKPFAKLTDYSHWVVAYSGGLDSTVLLHAAHHYLSRQTPENSGQSLPELLAVHVDHQLSPHHADWAIHCHKRCTELNIAFKQIDVEVDRTQASLERAARDARYKALGQFTNRLTGKVALLFAHHRDDQAETLLLRLLRGTGVYGAAAMLRQRALANADILRPLLSFSKAELLEYANQRGLSWIEDESNANEQFDRNFLRQNVTPLLASRWPAFTQNLMRFSALSLESQRLNDDLAKLDLCVAQSDDQSFGFSLSLSRCRKMVAHRRANLYRFCLKQFSDSFPDRATILRLDDWLMNQSSEGMFEFEACSFRLYREKIFFVTDNWLSKILAANLNKELIWSGSEISMDTSLAALGVFRVCNNVRGLKPGCYQISSRNSAQVDAGEQHAKLCIRGINKTIHKLMQELGVPVWLRDAYPLLYCGDKLAAIPPLVSDDFVEDNGCSLAWQFLETGPALSVSDLLSQQYVNSF